MSPPSTRIAVLSDIHGNIWALDAVLRDIETRTIERVLNLGDSLYGPLDPRAAADRLIEMEIPGVLGNEDRILLDPSSRGSSPSLEYTRKQLMPQIFDWLRTLPATLEWEGELFLCHGTPRSDEEYLLETVSPQGVELKPVEQLTEELTGTEKPVVLCGHSHVPRTVRLPDGTLVVNPGSVGLPAYRDNHPFPHAMENGSPFARYAVLCISQGTWSAELLTVEYPWAKAVAAASANGRPDWARWLATGCI